MADQGKWFKLWCSSLGDDGLENLELDDWARWVRLGTYMKLHGTDGQITVQEPARALLNLFRVAKFNDLKIIVDRFPNVQMRRADFTVSTETNTTVSWTIEFQNWFKYQGDFSSDRVKNFRLRKRARETAQEEKRRRREETRQEESKSPALSAVSELIDIFHQKLTDALNEKPSNFNGGALGRMFKAALHTHPVDEIKGRIDSWFKSTDPFVVSNGFSPTLFSSKFPLLKGGPIHASNGKPTNAFVASGIESTKYENIHK